MSRDGLYLIAYGTPLRVPRSSFSIVPKTFSSIFSATLRSSTKARANIAWAVLICVSKPPIRACTPRPVTIEASMFPVRDSG